MGFLDKIMKVFQKPLEDPTERQYYEIAFNLLRMIRAARYPAIKRYVDYKIGKPCDEEILKKALTYIKQNQQNDGQICYLNYSDSDFITGKYPEVNAFAKDIIKRTPYDEICAQREHAFCVCYSKENQQVKDAIVEAMRVPAKSRGKYFLAQTMNEVNTDMRPGDYALYIALKQSFLENEDVKEAVVQHYLTVLKDRTEEKNLAIYFGAMALRAAHFSKFKKDAEDYEPLSDGECEEYLTSAGAFEDQPFDDYPYLMGQFIAKIKECTAFYAEKTRNMFELRKFWDNCTESDYFMDAVCYYGWLKIREQYEDKATNICEMADMLYDYAVN